MPYLLTVVVSFDDCRMFRLLSYVCRTFRLLSYLSAVAAVSVDRSYRSVQLLVLYLSTVDTASFDGWRRTFQLLESYISAVGSILSTVCVVSFDHCRVFRRLAGAVLFLMEVPFLSTVYAASLHGWCRILRRIFRPLVPYFSTVVIVVSFDGWHRTFQRLAPYFSTAAVSVDDLRRAIRPWGI